MLYALNGTWATWVVDILALGVLVAYAIIAAKKGFIDVVLGLITTILSLLIAMLLMKSVLRWTNGLFGLQGVLEGACSGALGKINALNVDVSNEGLQAMLEEQNIPTFLARYVIESVGDSTIPAGTTLAMVIGAPMGKFIVSLITFFVLFILVKLLLILLKTLLSAIINKIPVVGTLNRILGAVVGVIQGLLLLSAIIAVLSLIPSDGLHAFFDNCLLLKLLYNHNLINVIIGWILV